MTAPIPSDTDARLTRALGTTYDVVRLLGVGGMGRVYLGHDRTLDRPVAIKVIVDDLAANATFRERFLREARTVARLRHPNIVSVYAAGEADGLLYFVMEFVDGESLRELIGRERALPAERAVPLLADVARALAYAHAHGVIHRDLKPENVLVDGQTGRALLTDFGVAHGIAPGDGRMTATGMVVGSPRYMSPEQAVGERDLDGRSDLYALGLVGYELLSGAVAFEGGSAGSMLARRLTSSPDPILSRAPNTPPGVAAAVERAVEREPDARWADGDAMAEALEDALADSGRTPLGPATPGSRRPGSNARRAARPGPRRWLPAAIGVAVVAVIAAVWGLSTSGPQSDRRTVLVLPFEFVGNDTDLGWLREGAVSMLTLDLSQWEDLGVIDYERTLDLLRAEGVADDRRISLTEAQQIARRAGATAIVLGQIRRFGDSLTVTARSYEADGGTQELEFTQTALASADPRALFDLLARQLLQIAGAPELSSTLAQTTTSSLNAYRAYLSGVRALNRWDTDSAQIYLRRATGLDSTFALAHYKMALALGWGRNPTDTMQIVAARAAVRHGARLRPSDRGLVEAYLPLAVGLDAANSGDAAAAIAQLDDARRRYGDLIQRDSLHAEAWYGLGDAHFHYPARDVERRVADMQAALWAFDRTLALDSTFHLAYAHKLQIYQFAATRGVPWMLDGDSLLRLVPNTPLSQDTARIRAARRQASTLTIREARRWADSDPDATPAHLAVATAYATAQDYAAAAGAIRHAMQIPRARRPDLHYLVASYELMAGRTEAAVTTFREARSTISVDSMVSQSGITGVSALVSAAAIPLHTGRLAAVDELLADVVRVTPTIPIFTSAGLTMAELLDAFAALGRAGAGAPWRSVRRPVDALMAKLPRVTSGELGDLRTQLPMIAFMVSRDTSYISHMPEASRPQMLQAPVIQGRLALIRGDTAAAERAATTLARGDTSVARNVLAMGLEAELLADLGDLAGARATYEAMNPRYLTTGGGMYLDPGWAVYARSFAERGALHEALGDRTAAIRDYEEFVARWANADAELQPQVRAARARIAALRDPGTTLPVPRTGGT